MNNAGDLTPTPQPDSAHGLEAGVSAPAVPPRPSWLRRHRRLLLPVGAALALGTVSAAAALVLLAKPANTVEKMVPAGADVMVLANLDPSVAQKLNLMRALHRFPDTKTDKAVTDQIDKAFKGTGLIYSGDIQPWLGAEVGLSARLNYDSTTDTTAVLYALSRDDTTAKASLAKLRVTDSGKKLQWRDETYNGFTISVGTPRASSDKPAAYSYVDHVVLIATSSAMIHDVIDTEQGRAARLVDTHDYKVTVASLPSDRVGLVYVNGKSLVAGLKKQMAKAPTMTKPLMRNVNDLDGLVGIGATLSAGSDGVMADLVVKLDQTRLSPSTRQALADAGRPDAVLKWIPRGSDAFLAVGNLNSTIQTLLTASGSDPSISASTNAIGLTGPGGVLPHLTGNAALEVEVGSSAIPGGAILLGTDDARSLNAFFGKLLALTTATSAGLTPGSGSLKPGAGSPALASGITTTTYRGVVITSVRSPKLNGLDFVPTYAVLDGMGILGSNLAQVKAVIDAHQGGETIAADSTYKAASAASLTRPTVVVYVNVTSLVKAVRRLPGQVPGIRVKEKALANVEPIRGFMLTASSSVDQAAVRFLLLIN